MMGMALIFAACADNISQPPATQEPTTGVNSVSTPDPTTEGPAVTPDAGGIGGQGLAISKSDVSGLADSALTAGEVLFIPEEHAAGLAETAGFDPSDTGGMRHATFQLDESQLAELAGTAAVIGADGRFPLQVAPARYLVCLADSFVDHTAGPPYSVVGCDLPVDIPEGASLTVTFGEGGVEASLD